MTEPTRGEGLLLSGVAGAVDGIGYVLLHVFTAHITGNTVHVGTGVGRLDLGSAWRPAFAIAAFVGGVAVGALTREACARHDVAARAAVLGVSGALLDGGPRDRRGRRGPEVARGSGAGLTRADVGPAPATAARAEKEDVVPKTACAQIVEGLVDWGGGPRGPGAPHPESRYVEPPASPWVGALVALGGAACALGGAVAAGVALRSRARHA